MPYLLHTEYSKPVVTANLMPSKQSVATNGPSLYELSYLQELAQELNTFLHSKGFSTIQEIQLGVVGDGYRGQLRLAR